MSGVNRRPSAFQAASRVQAAGAFEPAFGLVLRPQIAALSMSGSSFLVAVNAPLPRPLRLPSPTDDST